MVGPHVKFERPEPGCFTVVNPLGVDPVGLAARLPVAFQNHRSDAIGEGCELCRSTRYRDEARDERRRNDQQPDEPLATHAASGLFVSKGTASKRYCRAALYCVFRPEW